MPNGMVLGDGAFGRRLLEEIRAFIKVTPQSSLVPAKHVRIQQEVCNPEEGPHPTLLVL